MTNDFTVAEFAKSISVSKPTVWKHIGSGRICAYKVGRAVRIPFDELDRFRSDNRIEPSK